MTRGIRDYGRGTRNSVVTSYRDLKVWQAAMKLAELAYRQTDIAEDDADELLASADEVGKMLRGLQKSLKARL